jgi:hypothetical protein
LDLSNLLPIGFAGAELASLADFAGLVHVVQRGSSVLAKLFKASNFDRDHVVPNVDSACSLFVQEGKTMTR